MLTRIMEGTGQQEDLDKLVDVANKIEGHTICALGDAAAWPVQSFLNHYLHEFEYMVQHQGRSIAVGQLAKNSARGAEVNTTLSPSDSVVLSSTSSRWVEVVVSTI